MKRILITITSLLIALSGCGQKTGYDTLVSETKQVASGDGLSFTISSEFIATDSELDGTTFEINYIFDLKKDLFLMSIDDVDVYLTADTMYIHVIDSWLQKSFDIAEYSELQTALDIKNFITNLPNGDALISDNATGIKQLDDIITGKTLNDIVIPTADHAYTIAGAEDLISINTNDGLEVIITTAETGPITLSFNSCSAVELPSEATNALSIDDANQALASMASTSEV